MPRCGVSVGAARRYERRLTQIRPAAPADIPTILRFIRELAEFEKEPAAVEATEAMLHEALSAHGRRPRP